MNPILNVKNLRKNYEKFLLNDLTFQIFEKEIVGFLGPNGSGKTTTIKLLINSIPRDGGEVFFLGEKIKKSNIEFRRYIGYMPETGTPYEFLTAKEYLEFMMDVYKIKKDHKKIDELLNIFELKDVKKRIKNFSKGMKQKLLFISSIIHDPKLLILDEPFNSVDPQTVYLMKKILLGLKNEKTSIIFSSHILEIVEKLSDRIILLNNGIKVYEGEMNKIKKEGSVEELFNRLSSSNDADENLKKVIEIIKE